MYTYLCKVVIYNKSKIGSYEKIYKKHIADDHVGVYI